jgi:dephospho-CoA kinase
MRRPYIVGLTGGIASGKTTASERLKSLGATVVDADEISRELTAEGGEALPAIRAAFGDDIMNGEILDRKALAGRVFNDINERRALEAILHPMIQRRMINKIEAAAEAGERAAILSAPLLFESGMDALCDQVWLMVLNEEEQIKRAMARDMITEEEAMARIRSQMPIEEKAKRADVKIRADQPGQHTLQEIDSLYSDLIKRVSVQRAE